MCEALFGIRRRRAIAILQKFAGYQTGRTCFVSRTDLINQLRVLASSGSFTAEQSRKERLGAQLDELHRHRSAKRVIIPQLPESDLHARPALPIGVYVEEGTMKVQFETVEQLLQRLYAVAVAAADDFDVFCSFVEPATHRKGRSLGDSRERSSPATTSPITPNPGMDPS